MVSKWNLLIHGIIFRWTMLNFGSVLKTSGILRFFLVKHQPSFQLFWVIQNVSDSKLDDTKKLQFLYTTENRWSPWVYPPGWVRSPTIHRDIVILLLKSLYIAKAPTQTIMGPHDFPPKKQGYTTNMDVYFVTQTTQGFQRSFSYASHEIFFNPHKITQRTRVPCFQVFFEKNPGADFSITPPPPTKKTQPQPAECQSTIPPFILSSPSGFKSFSSTPSLDSGACCGTSGGTKGQKVGSSHLKPQNSGKPLTGGWHFESLGIRSPPKTNTLKPLDFWGVDLRCEGLTCIDGCASLHWLNDLEAKNFPLPISHNTPNTQNACI